ncbi:acyl-CoA thioesterase [Thermus thermophilus]|uniref:Putative thioesterase n=1 Tax=Thermus thermophilus JL-18 TaxID=798128 RepID=H9ZTZ4_THETH|nr:thioesterase family protein [Thermus thermophilus]AFH39804.1 putative thioesterase [Thermus thermophilus JL-18]
MEGFPVKVPVQVRFRDLDALGHVNNAVYLTYFEVARAAYFSRLERDWVERGHFILARAEVDFLRPIHLEDPVEVGVRVVRIGRSSFDMEYRVEVRGEEAARGRTVQVWLEGGSPAPLPEAIRERIRALEGRPL